MRCTVASSRQDLPRLTLQEITIDAHACSEPNGLEVLRIIRRKHPPIHVGKKLWMVPGFFDSRNEMRGKRLSYPAYTGATPAI
jgi:hypothetical protein